ncbi:MAG: hypothetical protein R3B45_14775 [Bdellovibrionota bacterium]
MKISFWLVLIVGAFLGCRSGGSDNSVKDLSINIAEAGIVGVAHIDTSKGQIVFYDINPDSLLTDSSKPLQAYAFKLDSSKGTMEIFEGVEPKGSKFPILNTNNDVNYGFAGEWSCLIAEKLLGQSVSSKGRKCRVELNTEDKYWYTFSAFYKTKRLPSADNKLIEDLQQKRRPSSLPTATQIPRSLDDMNQLMANLPLKPLKNINSKIDPKLLAIMEGLHKKFILSDSDKAERNTCLKNGRANGWLDLQAHFYCMLPYGSLRVCYSTGLVENTAALRTTPGLTSQQKVGIMVQAFWKSYLNCFGDGRPYESSLSDDEKNAFRYVMFTKQKLMDFNIDDEQSLINEFYKNIGGDERPRRVIDVYPKWSLNQQRYIDIRKAQLEQIKQQEKSK